MWVLLIIVIISTTIYAVPKIFENWNNLGIPELLEKRASKQSTLSETEYVNLYYLKPEGISDWSLVPYSIELSTRTSLNELIEMLITPQDSAFFLDGAITAIPSQTTLLGSLIRNGIAYVNFSSTSKLEKADHVTGKKLAFLQIGKTIQEFTGAEKVLILIDEQTTFTYPDPSE